MNELRSHASGPSRLAQARTELKGSPPGNPALPVIARLQAEFADLPSALARVAKYVVNFPSSTVGLSIEQLSEVTESGQASIVRLARKLGFAGFRDLKLALAAQIGAASSAAALDSQPAGEFDRLRDAMIASLRATPALLDPMALRAVCRNLAERRRTNLYGAGVSGLVCGILAAKLLRAGIPANAFTDFNIALEVIGPSSQDAVAIAISDSGTTPETVRMLRAAHAAGAVTVAITSRPSSRIASHADIVLQTAPLEQPPSGGVTTTIPAQMFVIEAMVELLASTAAGGPTARNLASASDGRATGRGQQKSRSS